MIITSTELANCAAFYRYINSSIRMCTIYRAGLSLSRAMPCHATHSARIKNASHQTCHKHASCVVCGGGDGVFVCGNVHRDIIKRHSLIHRPQTQHTKNIYKPNRIQRITDGWVWCECGVCVGIHLSLASSYYGRHTQHIYHKYYRYVAQCTLKGTYTETKIDPWMRRARRQSLTTTVFESNAIYIYFINVFLVLLNAHSFHQGIASSSRKRWSCTLLIFHSGCQLQTAHGDCSFEALHSTNAFWMTLVWRFYRSARQATLEHVIDNDFVPKMMRSRSLWCALRRKRRYWRAHFNISFIFKKQNKRINLRWYLGIALTMIECAH